MDENELIDLGLCVIRHAASYTTSRGLTISYHAGHLRPWQLADADGSERYASPQEAVEAARAWAHKATIRERLEKLLAEVRRNSVQRETR